MGDTKQVPRVPGSVIRDLLAAARQMVMRRWYQPFTAAACSFQRLDLALVNPGTVQTILVDDVTAAGGSRRRSGQMVVLTNCARCTENSETGL